MEICTDTLNDVEERADKLMVDPSSRGARTYDRGGDDLQNEALLDTTAARRQPPPSGSVAGAGDRRVVSQRVSNLSFAGATPSETEYERILGSNDLVDEFYLQRALIAAKPVCRLVTRNPAGKEVGFATGFMVSARLVLTNWHVFRFKDHASNGIAEFDYKLDVRGNPHPSVRFLLRPDLFYHSNKVLDYALVAVEPMSLDGKVHLHSFGYHKLVKEAGKIWEGEWITIIQHPGGQRRQFSIRENQLFEKQENFLWYASDTAPGSSGAPAFNDSFQVVALHHSGKARKENGQYLLKNGKKVDSLENVDETLVNWIANEGLRISVLCRDLSASQSTNNEYIRQLFAAMEGGDIMSELLRAGRRSFESTGEPTLAESVPGYSYSPGGAAQFAGGITIPLNLHVSLSYRGTFPQPLQQSPGAMHANGSSQPVSQPIEHEKVPFIDRNYETRTGYDKDFLGVSVPLPELTDESVVSTMDDGSHVIPYEHFSIVMHKERKLALYTASNIDGTEAMRKPEGRNYSRKELGELGENDRETWILDPRISQNDQLPDRFYNKDGGAFDKGHIVRRVDICWGDSKAQIKKANGDTYHVTNCSPQVSGFNQSSLKGIWGLFENHVLEQAKNDMCSVFSGPVLDDDYENFLGCTSSGQIPVKIPRKYWKLVVTTDQNGELVSFAFILEQSLDRLPVFEEEEFVVTQEWVPYLVSIEELERTLGLIKFPDAIKQADQSAAEFGSEILASSSIRRRPRKANQV